MKSAKKNPGRTKIDWPTDADVRTLQMTINKIRASQIEREGIFPESALAQTATAAGWTEQHSSAEIKAGGPAVPIDCNLVQALKLWQKEAAAGDIIGFAAVALCKNGTPVMSMLGMTSPYMAEEVQKMAGQLLERLGDCLNWPGASVVGQFENG